MPIEIKDIFFKFSGSFKNGGKKYIYAIPPKAAIFLRPNTNVLKKPSPKIGNMRSGENLLILATKRKIILAKTIGKINTLVFKDALKSNLFAVQTAIINIAITKKIFVIG